jgi:hypothetical protein
MDWTALLKNIAPWLTAAAGGPAGLAGMAIAKAAEALGASSSTTESITQAIAGATPEQLAALKKADQDFALQMQALGFKQATDLETLAVEDRKDARAMQVSKPSPVPAVLSLLVTLGYFGILVGMMTGTFKVSDSQALLIMLGSLGTAWGGVMAFWFGTTRDSARKTDLLAQSAPPK